MNEWPVIAINAAILPEFWGLNLGVPTAKLQDLTNFVLRNPNGVQVVNQK